jgi:hypothetical protein
MAGPEPNTQGRVRSGPRVHGSRTGAPGGASRRPRWDTDAGVTARDVAALYWIGQQYTARSDVLRVLLARLSPAPTKVEGQIGEDTLRQILDRWTERELILRDRLLGFLWVAPTPKALRLVGLDVRPWSFVIPKLAHHHAVAVVRLALEPRIPAGGRWISDRELREHSNRQVPDGAIELPDDPDASPTRGMFGQDEDALPDRYGIEVELSRKSAARLREKWTRTRAGMWKRTDYFAPPQVASYLTGRRAALEPEYRARIAINPLPEVPGLSYLRPGGGPA